MKWFLFKLDRESELLIPETSIKYIDIRNKILYISLDSEKKCYYENFKIINQDDVNAWGKCLG